MSFDFGGMDISLEAAEDLSSDQFHYVVIASGKVRRPDSAAERAEGILQDAPVAGDTAKVRVSGYSKIVAAAGGLAVGDKVAIEYVGATDAGKGLATTTAGTLVRGICVQAATAEDALATVRMVDFYYAIT
jgi:hypothetical protein